MTAYVLVYLLGLFTLPVLGGVAAAAWTLRAVVRHAKLHAEMRQRVQTQLHRPVPATAPCKNAGPAIQ